MAPTVKAIDPAGLEPAYYAPGSLLKASEALHISGQVGVPKDGTIPASYESQIHLALLNLRKVLVAAGASVKDIAKLTLYIVNYSPTNRPHVRILQKFLGQHRPAITLVPVTQLAIPGWLFEIEAVVAMQSQSHLPAALKPDVPGTKSGLSVDVVVVGAGLSGLTAASDLMRAGLFVKVLEARDRVGGKTWSMPLANGGGIVDLGAAWINDTNQSRMIALARKFGLELIEQNTTGNCSFQDANGTVSTFRYGELPMFDEKIRKNCVEIRDLVEEHCQAVDTFHPRDTRLDSLTFDAYLTSIGVSETARMTAAIWTRAMLGQEPSDISALYFLNYCKSGGGLLQMRSDRKHGGQYLRFRRGTQEFSKGIASTLPNGTIHLSCPVESIEKTGPSSLNKVVTPKGVFYAKKVILSVPTPVLKTIAFDPPLPEAKTLLADSTSYGYYTKVMVVFKSPFWVERGFCGLAQSFKGPISVIRDTSVPADGKWVLTCFLVGEPGRVWSLQPERQRHDQILEQIGQAFADRVVVDREFSEILGHEWTNEQYSGWGCPCPSLPPGVLDSVGSVLREPAGDVHFIGTETAGEWKGYMEGAVRSGERGAAEVASILSLASAKL